MNKKAILFDLDDTLYDFVSCEKIAFIETHKVLQQTFNITHEKFIELFQEVRFEVQRELQGTASSHNRVLYFQRMTEKLHNGTIMSDLILKLYNTYWDTIYSTMKPFNDAHQILSEIRNRGYKLGMVSNHVSDVQHKKLIILDMAKYFDVLVTSEEAGTDKPNPFIYLLALNKLDILPHEAVMIGDSTEGDISGANSVMITTVKKKVRDEEKIETSTDDHRKPDYAIRHLSELPVILDHIKSR